jgi:hypothetical protein
VHRFGSVLAAAALATAFCITGLSSGARADTIQTITGDFNDGGMLTGTLVFDQYGDLTGSWHLTTTTGSALTGATYGPEDVISTFGYYPPPSYSTLVTIPGSLEFWDLTYGQRTLTLVFSSPDVGQPDTLVGGYECAASYACANLTSFDRELLPGVQGGDTVGDVTTTPLPSTWTMMLLGVAGLGLIAYRRQRPSTSLSAA